MQASDTKQAAVKELLALIDQGRRFQTMPIADRAALAAADQARAFWQLQIKKAVRQLLGEAAGLMHLTSGSLPEPEGGRPGLALDVARFRDRVADQLSGLERVTAVLRRMA